MFNCFKVVWIHKVISVFLCIIKVFFYEKLYICRVHNKTLYLDLVPIQQMKLSIGSFVCKWFYHLNLVLRYFCKGNQVDPKNRENFSHLISVFSGREQDFESLNSQKQSSLCIKLQ